MELHVGSGWLLTVTATLAVRLLGFMAARSWGEGDGNGQVRMAQSLPFFQRTNICTVARCGLTSRVLEK